MGRQSNFDIWLQQLDKYPFVFLNISEHFRNRHWHLTWILLTTRFRQLFCYYQSCVDLPIDRLLDSSFVECRSFSLRACLWRRPISDRRFCHSIRAYEIVSHQVQNYAPRSTYLCISYKYTSFLVCCRN